MEVKVNNQFTPSIRLQNLTKVYGRFRALRGVNLEIAPGTFLALFGPNGAGKSTLLNMIAGLIQPSRGALFLDDINVTHGRDECLGSQVGVLSYDTYLYDELTVNENLQFYGKLYDIVDPSKKIEEMLVAVGMSSRSESRVYTLSHGMRQRVAIARALLHDPDILLLDEPYSGLDQDALVTLKAILTAYNKTVILVTHDLDRGLELADRVVILNRGYVVFDTPKNGLTSDQIKCFYKEHSV